MDSYGPVYDLVKNFLYGVYVWMSAGLLTTAAVSYYVAHHAGWQAALMSRPWILFVLIIAQLGIVFSLGLWLNRLSTTMARMLFLVYAVLTGVMVSSIFMVYSLGSIAQTFIVASGMFGGMSVYGYFTKTDLSSLGNILIMGLWGIIIATLVNMYFQSGQANLIISAIGVVIFSLLTAYDVQKIKALAYQLHADDGAIKQLSIFGALMLYLDFLNLFLYLLQFMGQAKEQR